MSFLQEVVVHAIAREEEVESQTKMDHERLGRLRKEPKDSRR